MQIWCFFLIIFVTDSNIIPAPDLPAFVFFFVFSAFFSFFTAVVM